MNNPVLLFLLCYLISLVGAVAHYAKRWSRGQTSVAFVDYLLGEPKHTVACLMTLVGAVAVAVSSNSVDLGSINSLGMLLLVGYTVDSSVNKAPDD